MTTTFEVPPQPKLSPVTATADVAQTAHTSAQNASETRAHPALHELIATDAECAIQNYGRLQRAFVRGEGARLWDVEGREYLDFLGGIAVVTLGHAHPKITEAVSRQAGTLLHTSNIFYIAPQVELARRLHELSGGMRAFFCNSGAEANEAALKIVRKAAKARDPQKFEIVTVTGSFHGRTYAALAATAQPKYHEGFEPMPSGFRYAPAGDVEALRAAIGPQTAAVMLEPIQGESGVRPLADDYLQAARELCDEHGVLLIFDEVQCGIGRTGTFFAWEQTGVRPDVTTLAKGLGNGVPIGALLASEEVAAAFGPGTHGCTFGGNFLSTAAALATIEVLYNERVMENALDVGGYFAACLREWGERTGVVAEVRGRGLMIGVELNRPIARDMLKAALDGGLVFNAVGDTVLRLLPPLTITRADVDEAMQKLNAAYEVATK